LSEMLSVKEVDVFYGDLQVLWCVNFKVNKGELVAVVGSNGAGKTSLLRTISGLIHPIKGQISFLGKRIDDLSPNEVVEFGVSYVPTDREIFPFMSVMENLEMGAYLRRAREKKEERLEFIHQLFPILKERRNQLAGTLSGGEQQMLAIARGLMASPKLLILDEPSFGLAPKAMLGLFKAIQRIKDEGTTVLLVEQNVSHTMMITDRAYVLEVGRVTLEGDSDEILQNPLVKKAYLGL